MKDFKLVISILFVMLFAFNSEAKKRGDEAEPEGFKFEDEIVLPATSIKNQYKSGTCWSFSGLSFLESEMLRLGKSEIDLSEMYIVRQTYIEKADKYVRLHGNLNFGAGGAFHDVINMIKQYGIVPEQVYTGLNYGEEKHVHGEMDRVVEEQVKAVIENKNKKLSTAWEKSLEGTLDAYLGTIPEVFEVDGEEYTPISFANEKVGLNLDDYIEISSYTHHPFYSSFMLEVPDNWSWDQVYNVPVNELQEITDYALSHGFTVAWAADVSEKGFSTSNKGIAVMPDVDVEELSDAEIARWEKLSEKERMDEIYKLDKPCHEIDVTQEMRQIAFDNYQTTDDHGMHIIGTARDQTGKEYYKVKNSWGNYNKFEGNFYASKPYFNYKTMCIMVHKDAVPKSIRKKLNL